MSKYRDTYRTCEEARADGWVRNPPAGWTKRDTSGYNRCGYEFTATSPDGRFQAVTHGVYITTLVNRVGDLGAVVNYYRQEDFDAYYHASEGEQALIRQEREAERGGRPYSPYWDAPEDPREWTELGGGGNGA